MQVYNISFQIEPSLEFQWLEWIKNTFVPSVMKSQCFTEHKLYQISVQADQSPTYTLQLYCANMELWQSYQQLHASAHLKEVQLTWGEKCYYFCTEMQIVN
ncbi:MAG: DUF4286 family protein [Bacteroidetes bacterium]|jgi:hypothetical protein|nr:DUF4286 family protein [Bacteroidota bacterium]